MKMIFPVRTTVGQEQLVVDILSSKISKEELNIYAISVVPNLKGYILIEADNEVTVRRGITDTPHIKGSGIVKGSVNIEELSGLLESKPLMKSIQEGQTVEIVSGPFKGEKAKVTRVNAPKEEVTVELLEAAENLSRGVLTAMKDGKNLRLAGTAALLSVAGFAIGKRRDQVKKDSFEGMDIDEEQELKRSLMSDG